MLVSASLDLYLQPWTRTQGIELICSRVEICDDRLTGHYLGADCCAEEKAKRIQQAYDLKEFGAVHAYGDTSEDREMLALADHAWMAWRQVKQSDNSESLTL